MLKDIIISQLSPELAMRDSAQNGCTENLINQNKTNIVVQQKTKQKIYKEIISNILYYKLWLSYYLFY